MRRLLVLLFVLPLALAAACGGETEDPFELVSKADATTAEAGTARMSMTTEISGAPEEIAEAARVEGEGVFDFETQRGSFTMSSGGFGEMEVMSEGTTVYMRFPLLTQQLGVDTEWVSIDYVRLTEVTGGADLGQLQQTGNDPTQTLAMLRGASDDIEEVGEEEVRGEATKHYRATVDLRKALESQGAIVDPEQFERFIAQLGVEEIDVDVWIDDEGRARRTRFEQPLPQQAGGATMTVTMELFDFGTDEKVELPPSEDVTDVTEKLAQVAESGMGTSSGTASSTGAGG